MPIQKVTKEEVVRQALLLFKKQGYHRTSMSDLATVCGLLKGSFYHYFSGKDALANVNAPLQLWQGDKDINVPDATNAKVIRDALADRVEFHSVPNAAHLSFLVPCGVLKMLPVCTDPAGFDRQEFHHIMNPLVVTFFDQQLAQP